MMMAYAQLRSSTPPLGHQRTPLQEQQPGGVRLPAGPSPRQKQQREPQWPHRPQQQGRRIHRPGLPSVSGSRRCGGCAFLRSVAQAHQAYDQSTFAKPS